MNLRWRGIVNFYGLLLMALFYATGCAHYPINKPLEQVDVTTGYRGAYMKSPGAPIVCWYILLFGGWDTGRRIFIRGSGRTSKDGGNH
jgi:hypothetical protein